MNALKWLQSYYLLVLTILGFGCRHELLIPPATETPLVSYSKDVAPILKVNCNYYGCHIQGNYSNIPLETYYEVTYYGQVIPFQPIGSNFNDVILSGYMPLGGQLSAKDQQLLYDWIAQGALDN